MLGRSIPFTQTVGMSCDNHPFISDSECRDNGRITVMPSISTYPNITQYCQEDLERETKFSHKEEQVLEVLRRMMLCQRRYRVTRCFCRWLKCPECAFLESDKLFKEHLIDLPDKCRVHQEPMAAPKWNGCERCGKIDQKSTGHG